MMPRCSYEALVEARRDGRLDAAEAKSVARHLTGCESCRRLADELDAIASLAAARPRPKHDPLSHRRRRLALLRDAAMPRRARARGPWPIVGVAAALALLFGVAASDWKNEALVAQSVGVPAVDTASMAIVATITAAPGSAYDKQLTGSSKGTLERIRLRDGSVSLHVERLHDDQRFIVATGDGEVEVRGTRFSVTAVQDVLTRVEVREGHVEVRHAGVVVMLGPGDSWQPPTLLETADDKADDTTPAAPVAHRERAQPVAVAREVASADVAGGPVASADVASAVPVASTEPVASTPTRERSAASSRLRRRDVDAGAWRLP